MKKISLLLFLCLTMIFQSNNLTIAQTSTSSGSETSNSDIKEKIQERIDNIKNSNLKKSFWGTLKNRTNSILLIEDLTGEKKLKTDENTDFVSGSKKAIKITDLEIGNFIIGLGIWQENGTLNAKKIILLPTPPPSAPLRKVVQGKITKISKQEVNIHNSKKNLDYSIALGSSTIITKKVDSQIKKVSADILTENDWLVVIGTAKTEGGKITPKIIHVIPGLSKPTASPTGSPTITPTP